MLWILLFDKEGHEGTWGYGRKWWNPDQIQHWGPWRRSGKCVIMKALEGSQACKHFIIIIIIILLYLFVWLCRIQTASWLPILGWNNLQKAQRRALWWNWDGWGTRAQAQLEATASSIMGSISPVVMGSISPVASWWPMCRTNSLASTMEASMAPVSSMDVSLWTVIWFLKMGAPSSSKTYRLIIPGEQTASSYNR